MSAAKTYVLDANVLIEAHQRYYGFRICPGFWDALIQQHHMQRVCSIDKVEVELAATKTEADILSEWVRKAAPRTFFKKTSDKIVMTEFKSMVKWVQDEPQFKPEAKAEFASVADGWLIAFAQTNALVVVTHEEYAPGAQRKVPIPNICIQFGVAYCNTFEMLKDLNEQFVLKKRRRKK